jgi:integrase
MDSDLVFPDELGEPLGGRTRLRTDFHRALKRSGLPPIRFHDLHRTAATTLLAHGVSPKIVSDLLGHASIRVTLDSYSHVLPDMQQQAAAVMDAVYGT